MITWITTVFVAFYFLYKPKCWHMVGIWLVQDIREYDCNLLLLLLS